MAKSNRIRRNGLHPLGSFLNEDTHFFPMEQSQVFINLIADLRKMLGAPLNEQLYLHSISDDIAILNVPSHSAAARLRFMTPQIIALLAQYGYNNVRQLKIQIDLQSGAKTVPPQPNTTDGLQQCHQEFQHFIAQNPNTALARKMAQILKKRRQPSN